MSDTDYLLQHVSNMRVSQARIHEADMNYYVITANGYVVRGPFGSGLVGKALAEVALKNLRRRAREELEEELEEEGAL